MHKTVGRLKKLLAETERLADTLLYYKWLEAHGTSWDQIKGIREADSRSWKLVPRHIRDMWKKDHPPIKTLTGGLIYPKVPRLIDFKLASGQNLILPWPPFDDGVIFNRGKCS